MCLQAIRPIIIKIILCTKKTVDGMFKVANFLFASIVYVVHLGIGRTVLCHCRRKINTMTEIRTKLKHSVLSDYIFRSKLINSLRNSF